MTDIDAYFERVTAAGAKVTVPLADRFYGMRDGRVEDPDGNQLSLGAGDQRLKRTPARGRIPRTSLPTNSSYFSSVRLSMTRYAWNFGVTCHAALTSIRVYDGSRTSPVAIDESSDEPT